MSMLNLWLASIVYAKFDNDVVRSCESKIVMILWNVSRVFVCDCHTWTWAVTLLYQKNDLKSAVKHDLTLYCIIQMHEAGDANLIDMFRLCLHTQHFFCLLLALLDEMHPIASLNTELNSYSLIYLIEIFIIDKCFTMRQHSFMVSTGL